MTSLWPEGKLLCESVLHLCHFQLGDFKDPIVDACQGVFPTPHRTSFDVAAVTFHHERPGCPHRACSFDSVSDVQQTVHGDRAGRHS